MEEWNGEAPPQESARWVAFRYILNRLKAFSSPKFSPNLLITFFLSIQYPPTTMHKPGRFLIIFTTKVFPESSWKDRGTWKVSQFSGAVARQPDTCVYCYHKPVDGVPLIYPLQSPITDPLSDWTLMKIYSVRFVFGLKQDCAPSRPERINGFSPGTDMWYPQSTKRTASTHTLRSSIRFPNGITEAPAVRPLSTVHPYPHRIDTI